MKKLLSFVMGGMLLTAAQGIRADDAGKMERLSAPQARSTPAVKHEVKKSNPSTGSGRRKANKKNSSKKIAPMAKTYVCPMDGTTSDKPGKCPKCGMDLVEKK